MKKRVIAFFAAVIILVACLGGTECICANGEAYELNCKNAIVVNSDTGRVVFEKGADEKVSIASLTKIMTSLVVIENCADLDALVSVKKSALDAIADTGLVTANLVEGEEMSVKDLLYCLLISSAADASVVLADYIGGSVSGFVELMNKKAAELGMDSTHFVNTHGLDAEGHYSTARDVATLTGYALKNELFCDIVSRDTYTASATNKSPERKVSSTNYLILENSGYYYKWADGVKTGYTGDAGRCLASTAVRNGDRYICIVLGCDAYTKSGAMACAHFSDSIELLDNAFNTYSMKKVCKKGRNAISVHVKCLGIDEDAQGVFGETFSYLLSKSEKAELKFSLDNELIDKPVKKGDRLGSCNIVFGGKTLKTVEIVAKSDTNRNYVKIIITALVILLAVLVAAGAVTFVVLGVRKKKGRAGRKRVKYNYTAIGAATEKRGERESRGKSKLKAVIIIAATAAVAVGIAFALAKSGILPSNVNKKESETVTESESVLTTEPPSASTEKIGEAPATTENTASSKLYVTTEALNVRTGPGTDYEKAGLIPKGTKVKVISEENGWSKIEYNGSERYVSSEYLETASDESGEDTTSAQTARKTVNPAEGNWNLVIVNAYTEYDKSYKPVLKEVCPGMGYDMYMDERAADHFTEMYNAAKKDSVTLTPISGYRSYELQEKNWKNRISNEEAAGYSHDEAVRRASSVILPPGTSEHNIGVAMDICSLYDSFSQTKEYKWLCENAADYGFILRYKSEWESKTGIVPEPWHWRYVGTEYAQKINASGLCLEDYVAAYGKN